ncbi:hypothetical protein B0H13DRAFT_2301266 [Mycena leptocephala]|nr:hypothetical protein B0H13DRAFT_2301266 [Mycena leptocephala]
MSVMQQRQCRGSSLSPQHLSFASAKAKAQAKKKKGDDSDSSEDSSDEIIIDETVSKTGVEVDWSNDPDLSVRLPALISEDADIKRSLYPPCGANASTKKGGGKPKVNAQWELALLLLGSMEKYKDVIAACQTQEKLVIANKIKNRLGSMAKTIRDFDKEMGETDVTNKFTTQWAEISDKCPWYFEMRNLIGQRQNLVPTGLGHSNTPVADGVIMPDAAVNDHEIQLTGQQDDDDASSIPIEDWETSPEPPARKRSFEEFDDEGANAAAGSGDDYLPSSPTPSESAPAVASDDAEDDDARVDEPKVKAKAKATKTQPNNSAKPGTSKPAAPVPAPAPKPAKKTKLAEFSDIAKNEEKTRQKELELAQLRTHQQMKTTEVKGRIMEKREDRQQMEKQAKQEARMQKLKLKELKLRQTHELRLAATRTGHMSATSHAASLFDSNSRASSSHYSPSEPADYEYDGLNGNAMAGSSHYDGFSTNAIAGPSTSGDGMDFSGLDGISSSVGHPFDGM